MYAVKKVILQTFLQKQKKNTFKRKTKKKKRKFSQALRKRTVFF